MGFKYRVVATTSAEETMFELYKFIVTTSSQSIYRLVNDTGTAVALLKFGTGFVTSWTSASDCPDGSYMVIEPVTTLGSYRHQIKLTNSAANVSSCQLSSRGGWTNAGAAFGASARTDATTWNDGAAPGAGSELYMGIGTFAIDGSNTGTFFWCNLKDTGSATPDQFCYAGSHYPFAIASDVNPVVLLARIPRVDNATSLDFGRNGADANNLMRTPVEVGQTTSMSVAGYARVGINDDPRVPGAVCMMRDRAGNYIPLPAYLYLRNSALVGYFGDHLRIVDGTLNDYDVNDATTPTRIVMGHLSMHFDITL